MDSDVGAAPSVVLGLCAGRVRGESPQAVAAGPPLPGTSALEWDGDLAARLVDEVDRFLLQKLDASIEHRDTYWKRDVSSVDAYQRSVAPQRQRLAHILGLRDPRTSNRKPDLMAAFRSSPERSSGPFVMSAGRGPNYDVYAIRWPAFGDVYGVGLLLEPRDRLPLANVIAIPDCEVLPEQLAGLLQGIDASSQYARRLAEAGCRVVVPLLINRQRGQFDWGPRPAPTITNREMLYRSAYELGRGLIAYELQQILAAVDWMSATADRPVGVIGWGEGGLLSPYAGALDQRIQSVGVSGYFDSRQSIWQEPIDRNVFGLLEQFGDAELASLVAPRRLIIEAARGPETVFPGQGGAPARLMSPQLSRRPSRGGASACADRGTCPHIAH